MKKILLLGAGLVSKPLVKYLLDKKNYYLIIATRTIEKARKLLEGNNNGESVQFNIETDDEKLSQLVQRSDLVISLLPYIHHPKVADICINHRKHMVTTSYVSPAMKEKHHRAKEAGIVILNEIGVDPGIDHMSAMRIIDRVHNTGGKVISFKSYCGGLPAPESNTNPFGYKFSWSPLGVLLAARNPARFLSEGKEVKVPAEKLFAHYHFLEIEGAGVFEAYPNRDSIPYLDLYGLKECKTMSRWTLRNISHCETWQAMADLGLFSDEKMNFEGMTFASWIIKQSSTGKGKIKNPVKAVMKKLKLKEESTVLKKLEWLGLFSQTPIKFKEATPVEILSDLMVQKMQYQQGERDMIVMYHEFIAEYPQKKEKIIMTLVDYGIPDGDSSMSRTVSLPAAIASTMILEGKIISSGVIIPVLPQIYNPVLEELKNLGIDCKEKVSVI